MGDISSGIVHGTLEILGYHHRDIPWIPKILLASLGNSWDTLGYTEIETLDTPHQPVPGPCSTVARLESKNFRDVWISTESARVARP